MEHQLTVAHDRLKSFIERIERIEADKAALAEDIKDIFTEIKLCGLDAKIVSEVIRLRKMDPDKRREQEDLIDLYMTASGSA